LRQLPVPENVVWYTIYVTCADGPRNFYVAANDEATYNAFCKLEAEMNTFYNKFHEKYEDLPFDSLVLGGYYVVRRDFGGKAETRWDRCQILQLITPSDYVVARLVDTGETIRALPKEFRRIKQIFATLSIQAYQVSLHPPDNIRDREVTEDCERFKTAVVGKQFDGIYLGTSSDTGNMQKFRLELARANSDTLELEWLSEHYN